MTAVIRRARTDEAAAISALAVRSKAVWGYEAAFLERCRPELTITAEDMVTRTVCVYEADAKIRGFYALAKAQMSIEIEHFFVEPAMLRTGIGSALWRHLKSEAIDKGARRLAVTSDPFAEGFYRRLGFARIGERPSGSIPGRMLPYLELQIGTCSPNGIRA